MCIKLGSDGDVGYRISDDGQFQSQEIEENWYGCNVLHVCGQPIRESLGLGGVSVVAYRLRLANNKSIIIRHIDGSYFDVDELQTRLERDLAADRHCIR